MGKIVTLAQMTVSGTPGTGVITLGSASTGFQSFAAAGVNNGDVISYSIVDGSNFEYGQGTYASSGPTLTRTTIQGSSNAGAAVSLTSAAIVAVSALATDFYSTACLGAFRNLQASATGTGANITETFDELVVENASNIYQILRSGSLTSSLATSGANGIDNSAPQTVTVTIASPGVFTLNGHGFPLNAPVVLATSGALPTGYTAGTTYYVTAPTTNTFQLSATKGGSAINSTGSQSGTHTVASVLAVSSWYSKWVIWNGTTVAGLLSSSTTNPVLPSGYTHKARTGWVYTDSSGSKYPLSFVQFGRRVQYKVAASSNVAALPTVASGVNGSTSTPTWVSVSTANFSPPTAAAIVVVVLGANSGACAVAPSNAYGAVNTGSNRPPVVGYVQAGSQINISQGAIVFETANTIYVASDNASNSVQCFGWEDNL